MKTSTLIAAALILAAGIAAVGLAIKSGIDNFTNRDRVVTVRGLCEKEVPANKVTWPIVTKELGNDLPSLYSKTESVNKTIITFLKNNGIDDAEISISPLQVYDYAADRYGSSTYQYRFQTTNVVVVTSEKVEQVRKLIERQADLMRQGIAIVAGDYSYQTTYEYTDLNSIKPTMIAEATAAARTAADTFASDSNSKLGKIKTASQGQFSISDRDQYTPNLKTVRVVTYITYYLQD